jgi:Domain of unknown function (DUF4062)
VKVMISSVRRGLEAERDALTGLIMALGHAAVRFEDFSALPQPSREACMRAVQESDVYLLILGPHYGHVFPETGQSATHDEFVAAQEKGIPRIVLQKTGVQFDPQQEDFIKLVGDYGTGVFWDTFTDATDIQAKVVRAIKRVQDQPTPLTFIPLPRPVTTEWRRDWLSMASGLGLTACLEAHVLPVPTPARLSARAMDELSSGLLASLRASGGVPPEVGLELVREPSGAVVFRLPETHRRFDEVDMGKLCGIRVSTSKQVSLWYTLPRGGRLALAVLDPNNLAARITEALRLTGRLQILGTDHIAVAAGIDPASLTTVGKVSEIASRGSATFAGHGQLEFVHVEPDEAASPAALDLGAAEAARPIVQRLIDAAA